MTPERSAMEREAAPIVWFEARHRLPLADRQEGRERILGPGRWHRLRQGHSRPATGPSRDQGELALQVRPTLLFPQCRSKAAQRCSNALRAAAHLPPTGRRRDGGKSARRWSSRKAVIDPMQKILDLSGALRRIEQFERGFPIERLRRTAQPSESFFLRPKRILGGSQNPHDANQPVRLFRRQPADLSPVAERLSWQNDSVNFHEGQSAELYKLLNARDWKALTCRFDKAATSLASKSRYMISAHRQLSAYVPRRYAPNIRGYRQRASPHAMEIKLPSVSW
jgi:hypothetical protein